MKKQSHLTNIFSKLNKSEYNQAGQEQWEHLQVNFIVVLVK